MSVHDEVHLTVLSAVMVAYREELYREASLIDDGEDSPAGLWEPWMRTEVRALMQTGPQNERILEVQFLGGQPDAIFHDIRFQLEMDNIHNGLTVNVVKASPEYTLCDVVDYVNHMVAAALTSARGLDPMECMCCIEDSEFPDGESTPNNEPRPTAKVLAFPKAKG